LSLGLCPGAEFTEKFVLLSLYHSENLQKYNQLLIFYENALCEVNCSTVYPLNVAVSKKSGLHRGKNTAKPSLRAEGQKGN